jgi:hypothetical protein
VNLNGHESSFTATEIEVDVPAPELYTAVPGRVSVTVEVEPEVGEHTIEDVPVQVSGQPDAAVTPPTVSVTVRGPIPLLRALAPTDVVARVEDDGRPPGRARASQVRVEVPGVPDVEILSIRPSTVVWKK